MSILNSEVNVDAVDSAPQKPSTTACQKISAPLVLVHKPVAMAAMAVAAKLAHNVP